MGSNRLYGMMLRGIGLRLLLMVGVLAGLLGATAPALAVVPGQNGKIAFTSYRDGNSEIYVMNADGSGMTNVTRNSYFDAYPAWSPDGSKIVHAQPRLQL